MDAEPQFSRWRRYVWPIHKHELRKFLPMLAMAFCIGFAFNILRNMKDSLLVTAQGSGAEVLPFVKVWAMLPMAILITSIFVKLSHRYSTERVFYMMITGFVSFFLLFVFILYPLRDVIHPHGAMDWLEVRSPEGLKGMIAMVRYWSFALFYAFSELWGTVILSVLFWGFTNEVSKVHEAQRFYGLLGIGANFASVAAGKVSLWLCQREFNPSWFIGADKWHQSLILLTLCIAGTGALVMLVFRWFTTRVLEPGDLHRVDPAAKLERKKKGSIRENFTFLLRSRYLMSVAVIVFSYNIFINLVEVLWKDKVRGLYPDPSDYFSYMSSVTIITGFVATAMALFASGNVIRKCGWTVAAMVTPIVLLITSIGFFGFYLFPEHKMTAMTALIGLSPTAMVVFFGSMQNIISRGSKYSIFDATKELTFIPLNREMRVKGKAAIDGVGSRIGKSSGSVVYQALFMLCSGLSATAPFVGLILAGVFTGWILCVKSLGRQFKRLTDGEPEETPQPLPVEAEAV